ncbi:MAG: PQQ-dependent sugar dehydrogenase [Acidimicrobiales bacterium]
MRRSIGVVAAVAALFGQMATTTDRAAAEIVAIGADPVATGLGFPAGFTFAPDGRIFYGERFTGELRVRDPASGDDTRFFTFTDLVTGGEQGLLAVALHPNYPAVPHVFAYVTRLVAGVARAQLVRLTDQGGGGGDLTVLLQFGSATRHIGGRLLFGPGNKLFLVVGERGNPADAQNLDNLFGKILRLNADGGILPNNPFPGSPIYAYGIRNSFGFAFDPGTRRIWLTDNGPECNDELNRIVPARNHAWGPSATCATPPAPPRNTNQDGPRRVLPKRFYTPTIAPTGAAFCAGCRLGNRSEGALFFGAFNTGEIRRVTLTENRLGVASQAIVYDHPSGVLGLEVGPDDRIYFSTDNAIYRLTRV